MSDNVKNAHNSFLRAPSYVFNTASFKQRKEVNVHINEDGSLKMIEMFNPLS